VRAPPRRPVHGYSANIASLVGAGVSILWATTGSMRTGGWLTRGLNLSVAASIVLAFRSLKKRRSV
jgi:hypothetical protein